MPLIFYKLLGFKQKLPTYFYKTFYTNKLIASLFCKQSDILSFYDVADLAGF